METITYIYIDHDDEICENKTKKNFSCSYCKTIGHKINFCNSEKKTNLMNKTASDIQIINTVQQLKDYLSSLLKVELKIISLFYNQPHTLKKKDIVERLTLLFTEVQISGLIQANDPMNVLKLKYPDNMELSDIIQKETISRLNLHLGYESFNIEYSNIINWLESLYFRQTLDVRSEIVSGFTSAIVILRNRLDAQIIADPEPVNLWYVEPTIICLESVNELKIKKECNICYEEQENIHFSKVNCNHEFCNTCIHKFLNNHLNKKVPCCPLCRNKIDKLEVKDIEMFNDFKLCFSKYNN